MSSHQNRNSNVLYAVIVLWSQTGGNDRRLSEELSLSPESFAVLGLGKLGPLEYGRLVRLLQASFSLHHNQNQ